MIVAAGDLFGFQRAVLCDELLGHGLYAADSSAVSLVSLYQLRADRLIGEYDIISVKDKKGFVTDEFFSTTDCMTETARYLLPDKEDIRAKCIFVHRIYL